jgi:hypothetical protein
MKKTLAGPGIHPFVLGLWGSSGITGQGPYKVDGYGELEKQFTS